MKKMMYIITYRSHKQYHDKEIFTSKNQAWKRYQQLAQCSVVDQLRMQEI